MVQLAAVKGSTEEFYRNEFTVEEYNLYLYKKIVRSSILHAYQEKLYNYILYLNFPYKIFHIKGFLS